MNKKECEKLLLEIQEDIKACLKDMGDTKNTDIYIEQKYPHTSDKQLKDYYKIVVELEHRTLFPEDIEIIMGTLVNQFDIPFYVSFGSRRNLPEKIKKDRWINQHTLKMIFD